jgi:16S rRNA (guanine966-N2)-methyltransferase
MRIIAGKYRGKKLTSIKGDMIRPTSDRVREAVFNILGQKVRHASVLDLFAGTGALGLEALSRGAHRAVFADLDCKTLQTNINLCSLQEKSETINCNIIGDNILEQTLKNTKFDLIFMDPPYHQGLLDHMLNQDFLYDIMHENTIIIAEHHFSENIGFNPSRLDIYRQKKYSKTIISFINKK